MVRDKAGVQRVPRVLMLARFGEATIVGWVDRYRELPEVGAARPDQQWNRLTR